MTEVGEEPPAKSQPGAGSEQPAGGEDTAEQNPAVADPVGGISSVVGGDTGDTLRADNEVAEGLQENGGQSEFDEHVRQLTAGGGGVRELAAFIREKRGEQPNLRLDLRGARLTGADLSWVDLSGADLSGADLRGTDFRGTDFRGTDFSGARLTGADLRMANLSGTKGLTVPQLSEVLSLFGVTVDKKTNLKIVREATMAHAQMIVDSIQTTGD